MPMRSIPLHWMHGCILIWGGKMRTDKGEWVSRLNTYIQAQVMSKCYMMCDKRRRSGRRTRRAVSVEWIMICISYNNQEAC